MTLHQMSMSNITYDDVEGSIRFSLIGNEYPPAPASAHMESWVVQSMALTTPALRLPSKAPITPPKGRYRDPSTGSTMEVTWNGTAWSSPVVVTS